MSWLGGLVGVEKTVEIAEKTLSGVGGWIDEQQFTDEEKSNANRLLLETSMEFYRIAYDQNSIRSVTRRWLAWGIVAVVLTLAIASVVAAAMGNSELVVKIVDIVKAFWLGEAFVAVIAFYFGKHLLQR